MTPTRSAAIAVATAALLAACSSDPQPKFEDPSPAPSASETSASPVDQSPSTSPVATPSAPALPEAAKVNSPDGANAFARWWVDMSNYAQHTGDTSLLGPVNDSRCSGCNGAVDAVKQTYGAGGHIEGGGLTIQRFRELPLDYGADWAAVARGVVAPQRTVASDGSASSSEGGNIYLYVYVGWAGDHWSMRWVRAPEAKS